MKYSIQLKSLFLILISIIFILKVRHSSYLNSFRVEREVVRKSVTNIVLSKRDDFISFREAVGMRESSNNYKARNRFGYIGKYQFGKLALQDTGIEDSRHFLNNPKAQDRAFKSLCRINKFRLRNHIAKYAGKVINGISITESGLLAASHLVGAGSVKKYLESNGELVMLDGNKVSVESYIKKFNGYNLNLIAIRKV